jgi:hypothetical protein
MLLDRVGKVGYGRAWAMNAASGLINYVAS